MPVVAGSPDTMSAAVGSGAVDDYAGAPLRRHLVVDLVPRAVQAHRPAALDRLAAGGAARPLHRVVRAADRRARRWSAARDAFFPGAGDDGYERLEELAARARRPAAAASSSRPGSTASARRSTTTSSAAAATTSRSAPSRRSVARAVFEGVALNARWMHHYVERFAKRRLEPIAFIGGGARSALWCQIMADVLGREIRQVERPGARQRARRGAARRARARRAAGATICTGAPQVRGGARARPGRRATTYDELYAAFVGIYKANKQALRAAQPRRGGSTGAGGRRMSDPLIRARARRCRALPLTTRRYDRTSACPRGPRRATRCSPRCRRWRAPSGRAGRTATPRAPSTTATPSTSTSSPRSTPRTRRQPAARRPVAERVKFEAEIVAMTRVDARTAARTVVGTRHARAAPRASCWR